ncbi:MAG: beta-ketoacyl-[acyl-carrier-protein] synthase family protein [Phycisphaeraceae bacterium]|nr:beta-ketoacyl-[acyl-carrier-protein] synthase family protein [Phycisphaeraceae bacterium]
MATRIVITGIGWVTPLGEDIETVWRRLLAGDSAIRPTSRFDAGTFPTQFSAQVADSYDFRRYVSKPHLHEQAGYNTRFALGAAGQAWRHAGLDSFDGLNRRRLGIYLGSGEGSLDFDNYVQAAIDGWDEGAKAVHAPRWANSASNRMKPLREIEQEPHMPLTHLAMEFGAQGPTYNCLTACAASTQAIGEASELLRLGKADVMISGGAHTMIHPFGVTGFNRLTALSTRNGACVTASRPFSGDRDGFVLGEGAGALILETLDHAKARNAPILAEITGYGSSADAFRITDMHPEGRGPHEAMRLAVQQAHANAGVTLADIDYISAHGTSTKENDAIETMAIRRLFADRAKQVPVSSVKSMLGHLIAAAGCVEAIVCVLSIRDNIVPPTINLNTPDPECDLDYVPNVARKMKVDVCLSNSFGFGGQNDTLVIQRYRG